jgi:hypothetical protein
MLYSTHKDYLKNFIEQSLDRGQFFGEDKKYVFFNTQKRGRAANSKNWLVFPPMTPIELIDSSSKKGAKVFHVSVSGVPLVLQHRPRWARRYCIVEFVAGPPKPLGRLYKTHELGYLGCTPFNNPFGLSRSDQKLYGEPLPPADAGVFLVGYNVRHMSHQTNDQLGGEVLITKLQYRVLYNEKFWLIPANMNTLRPYDEEEGET